MPLQCSQNSPVTSFDNDHACAPSDGPMVALFGMRCVCVPFFFGRVSAVQQRERNVQAGTNSGEGKVYMYNGEDKEG